MEVRIQKYLSEAGICSRRKGEEYITQGLIKINGKVITELGTKIDTSKDKIELNKKIIIAKNRSVYIMLNKPVGIVTTCAKYDERSVLDLIKIKERVYPVGRLDKDSEGLLLLTNDGVVAYRLTHPKFEHEKEYEVTVNKNYTKEQISKLSQGVKLFGENTNPTRIKRVNKNKFTIILTEGKNRHIRRVCRKVGLEVVKLKRVRIVNLRVGDLKVGEYRELTKVELSNLIKSLGISTTMMQS